MTRSWTTLAGLALVTIALFAAYSGVLYVLLPKHIAAIDPEHKVQSLATVTAVSFAFTAVAQPLFGALSDRTRSRWGRRLPWMLGCAVLGGAALGAMGLASSIAVLVVLWALAQFLLNGTDVTSTVYLIDAFPSRSRGRVAGILGLAAIGGGVVGTVLSGQYSATPGQGYVILALGVVGAVAVFAAVSGRSVAPTVAIRRQFRWREFLAGFVVSPRRNPDFFWLVAWRVAFAVGYGSVHGYLLYLLTDFVRVDEVAAAGVVGQLTAIGGVGVVVGILVGGWWSDRVARRKPFLVVACLLVAVADLVPLAIPTVPGLMVLASALGVSLGVAIACGTALASEILPDAVEGAARGMGTFNLGTNLGQAAAPLIAAVVISGWAGYAGLFIASAVAMLLATGALVVGVRGGATREV